MGNDNSQKAIVPSQQKDTAARRALIVDDNADAADTLAALLEMLGFTALVAYGGEAAIAAAEREHPDIVISDIAMPGIDGYELARRLRARNGASPVTLVAVTGFGERHTKIKAFEAGFDYHLTKPVAMPELLRALRRA